MTRTHTIPAKALIFDMDGTLVDNMHCHNQAWEVWFKKQGLPFDAAQFFELTAGRSNAEILADFLPHAHPDSYPKHVTEKDLTYQQLYLPQRAPIAGLMTFLDAAKAANLPCGIGSGATQNNVDFILPPLNLTSYFQAVVIPSATIRGKPHPDIFLEAARQLGVAPQDCVVFEDAPLGIRAAHAAGMRCVALTTHLSAAELEAELPAHIMADYTHLRLNVALDQSLAASTAGFQLVFSQ
jgi:beta-phosphoglucomutase